MITTEKRIVNVNVIGTKKAMESLINPDYVNPNDANVKNYNQNDISFKTKNAFGLVEILKQLGAIDEVIGTNEQVGGIQESDLLKSNGSKLFYIPTNEKKLVVIKLGVFDRKPVVEKSIKLSFNATDMYITNDKLVVLGSKKFDTKSNTVATQSTKNPVGQAKYKLEHGCIEVFDINTLESKYTMELDCDFEAHRVVGHSMFLVAKKLYTQRAGELRPIIYQNGKETYIDYDKIFYFIEEEKNIVTLLASLNLDDFTVSGMGFLGEYYKNVFMNQNTFYMAEGDYNPENLKVYCSRILKFDVDLDKTALIYKGVGLIDGYILNQYSMNEYNGMLRVVTTENGQQGVINRLTILKEATDRDQLETQTVIDKGIGLPGELVKSVTFLKNLVSICTFKKQNRDPIYTIDISDIHKPIFRSEIKEDGNNAYMYNWGNNKMIGIGAADNFDNGIKIAAYNTDGTVNKPIDRLVLMNNNNLNYAAVLDNPKAMLISKEKGFIGMNVGQSGQNYFELTKVNFNRIAGILKSETKITHEGEHIDRAVYVNGIIYTVSAGKVKAYDYDKGTNLNTLELKNA